MSYISHIYRAVRPRRGRRCYEAAVWCGDDLMGPLHAWLQSGGQGCVSRTMGAGWVQRGREWVTQVQVHGKPCGSRGATRAMQMRGT